MEQETVKPEKAEMSFLDHLEELRNRILKCLGMVLAFAIAASFFTKQIVDFLARPLPVKELIFLNPTDAFMVRLKAAIIVGVMVSLPFIFYQLWAFIAPGLYKREQKYVLGFVFFATLFFLGGVSFGFFVMLPFGIKFLLGYQTDVLKPSLAVSQYFGFIFKMLLAFGAVFELPLISFFLTKIGLISSVFLREKRRYAIVVIFIVAAVLTPPDIFSQILMAIPLLILYEISIIVCKFAK